MRIGILTTDPTLEEARLIESGSEKGHEVIILEVLKCSIGICPDDPRIYYEGKRIGKEFDAIIPRIDPPHTQFGFMILRQFQAIGVYVTDTAYSLELSRDKIRCLQYLMRRNVPFPTTGFAHTSENYDEIISTVGGAPLIIKLNEGTEGIGVFLAEDDKAAKNFLHTFNQLDTQIMLQNFIRESSGIDIRVVVLGGKVIGAYERRSQDGDFRANVAQGGHSFEIQLTGEEEDVALRATSAVGLSMAGVDLIRSNSGPLVIEINSALDFVGEHAPEGVSGIDFAGMIIDYAAQGKKKFDAGEGHWLQNDPDPSAAKPAS